MYTAGCLISRRFRFPSLFSLPWLQRRLKHRSLNRHREAALAPRRSKKIRNQIHGLLRSARNDVEGDTPRNDVVGGGAAPEKPWSLPEPMRLPKQGPRRLRAQTTCPGHDRHERPWTKKCAPSGSVNPEALAIPRFPANAGRGGGNIVLASRKPILLFRLSGLFLLRWAARRFCGLLFQEPPRRRRRQGAVQGGD
jgi:hypothetical protein